MPSPHRLRSSVLLAVALAAAPVSVRGDVTLSRRDADSLLRKLVTINEYAVAPRGRTRRATTVTEGELNAYLRYHAAGEIPTGVTEPYVTILGGGRLGGRATVDLDAVRRQKERGWLDPLGYLTGRLPIEAGGVLRTRDGIGQFDLQSASIAGIPVPKVVLQEVVTHYSRRPEKPEGVALDGPFELPARIREIRVGRGQAVIVQ